MPDSPMSQAASPDEVVALTALLDLPLGPSKQSLRQRLPELVSYELETILSRASQAQPEGEAFDRLRLAYQDMEARCASYQAAAKIDLNTLSADRRELALWVASEAQRWLDPRAGGGPSDSFGKRLEQIAGVLALAAAPPPVAEKGK